MCKDIMFFDVDCMNGEIQSVSWIRCSRRGETVFADVRFSVCYPGNCFMLALLMEHKIQIFLSLNKLLLLRTRPWTYSASRHL